MHYNNPNDLKRLFYVKSKVLLRGEKFQPYSGLILEIEGVCLAELSNMYMLLWSKEGIIYY